MSLTVYLALVFHIFIAVAIVVMVCGRHGIGPKRTTELNLKNLNNSRRQSGTKKSQIMKI